MLPSVRLLCSSVPLELPCLLNGMQIPMFHVCLVGRGPSGFLPSAPSLIGLGVGGWWLGGQVVLLWQWGAGLPRVDVVIRAAFVATKNGKEGVDKRVTRAAVCVLNRVADG